MEEYLRHDEVDALRVGDSRQQARFGQGRLGEQSKQYGKPVDGQQLGEGDVAALIDPVLALHRHEPL